MSYKSFLIGYALIAIYCHQLTIGITTTIDQLDKPKRCTLERISRMMGYTCAGMNYNEIPKNLKTGIEVCTV